MYEDINIDELIAELASRNLPVCFKAAYVIGALRGKKSVIPAVIEAPVEAVMEAVIESPVVEPAKEV